MIYEALDKWGTAGQLLLSMRMYHHRVRKIQRFWAKYGGRMHEVRDKVKERFREMEREIIISTLGVKPGGGGMERRRTITRDGAGDHYLDLGSETWWGWDGKKTNDHARPTGEEQHETPVDAEPERAHPDQHGS